MRGEGHLGCMECEPSRRRILSVQCDMNLPSTWDRKVSNESVLTLNCVIFSFLLSSHSWSQGLRILIPRERWDVNLLFLPYSAVFPDFILS